MAFEAQSNLGMAVQSEFSRVLWREAELLVDVVRVAAIDYFGRLWNVISDYLREVSR